MEAIQHGDHQDLTRVQSRVDTVLNRYLRKAQERYTDESLRLARHESFPQLCAIQIEIPIPEEQGFQKSITKMMGRYLSEHRIVLYPVISSDQSDGEHLFAVDPQGYLFELSEDNSIIATRSVSISPDEYSYIEMPYSRGNSTRLGSPVYLYKWDRELLTVLQRDGQQERILDMYTDPTFISPIEFGKSSGFWGVEQKPREEFELPTLRKIYKKLESQLES